LEHCERANAGAPITIFEIETAAAFCLFAQHPADVVLLEVGSADGLNAPTVIEAPLVTVIAPVSMDHTEFLGDTLTAIALRRPPSSKRGVAAVCAEQAPRRGGDRSAGEGPARAAACGRPASGMSMSSADGWSYQDDRGLRIWRRRGCSAGISSTMPVSPLRRCARRKLFRIEPAAFEAGIINAEWPARMQRLASGALGSRRRAVARSGSMRTQCRGRARVAAALGDLEERGNRGRWFVIVGMMGNKDANAFLANFAGLTRQSLRCRYRIATCDAARSSRDAVRQLGMRVETAPGVEAALRSLAGLAMRCPPRISSPGRFISPAMCLPEWHAAG